MGIHAELVDENGAYTGEWSSKAVFTFFALSLGIYCRRGEYSAAERDQSAEELEWFEPVRQAMREPLCLLHQATIEPWEYTIDEYSRYLSEQAAQGSTRPLTAAQFAARCSDPVDPFLAPARMARIVRELVHVLKTQRPRETYLYDEEWTLFGLEKLIDALEEAEQQSIPRVRIGYS